MTEGSTSPVAKRKRELSEPDADEDRANAKRVSPNEETNENGESSSGGAAKPKPALPRLMDEMNNHHNRTEDEFNTSVEAEFNAIASAAAALGMYPTMSVPRPTDISFAAQSQEVNHDSDPNWDTRRPNGPRTSKPLVGSDEWHKIRKDNHKEVERRRRETINEGINELAKIVPGCEKNKGSILQRAVQFITQLKENEAQNIEKWTLEKLLTEQAIAELSASNDKLKQECERAWREVETWKKTCQSAGLTVKDDDTKQEP